MNDGAKCSGRRHTRTQPLKEVVDEVSKRPPVHLNRESSKEVHDELTAASPTVAISTARRQRATDKEHHKMTETASAIDVDVPDVTPVEKAVLNALRSYSRAIETARRALAPLGDVEAATQADLDQIGGVIAVVEETQLTLYSTLRSVGRPVPSPLHSD
jgi:hypothetical protein